MSLESGSLFDIYFEIDGSLFVRGSNGGRIAFYPSLFRFGWLPIVVEAARGASAIGTRVRCLGGGGAFGPIPYIPKRSKSFVLDDYLA